jgi:MoxR-like ATPase
MAMARAHAAIKGRDYVIPDDIKYFAVSVLAHRIVLIPELWLSSNESLLQIQKILDLVRVPMLDVEVS